MLYSKTIPAVYNGVSQQPATLRLSSQFEGLVNVYPTVVDGARKRPPSEHVAKVTTSDLSTAYIHTINRSVDERYTVVLTNGDIRVFDMTGAERTVTFPSGKAYLEVTDAKKEFGCVTVADYTFVVNKSVMVQMDELGADEVAQPDTYYWLSRDMFGTEEAYLAAAKQYQYSANKDGGIYKGVVQAFEDLQEDELDDDPEEGDVYKVNGNEESNFTSYYVRRTEGVWNETVGPDLTNQIDGETLPHALVRKSDGTFEFGPFSFAPRRVGDEDTNPNPSFVGRGIRDIMFYKNRLGFAVDENVVLSRAGDFGNFYRLTVLDLLEDETIDIGASETKVTLINHAVPFNNSMMLFSEQVQFRLNHGDVLSPTSASIDPVTSYQTVTDVRPLPVGSDVYFVAEAQGYASVREYYVRRDAQGSEAGNVTAHVPRFIPAGVTRLIGSSTHDVLFVLTDGAPNRVYVYKFHWTTENQKAQSAWFYWEYGAGEQILSADIIGDYLYTFVKRSDGTYIERTPLESGATAPGLNYQLFLDRRAQVNGVYQSFENVTQFTLPYPPNQDTFRIVRGAGFGTSAGALVLTTGWTWVSPTVVKVPGNVGGSCIVGETYKQRFDFSEVFMTNKDNVPIVTGRLQLRTYTVYFLDTAYFQTEVAPYGTSPDLEEVIPHKLADFDGKTLGQTDLTLGTPVFSKGAYTFSVWGDSTLARVSLTNDTPYGFTLQQMEWEGFHFNRARQA